MIFSKIFPKKTVKKQNTIRSSVSFSRLPKPEREKILRKGAQDFATRFEGVMRELSNG